MRADAVPTVRPNLARHLVIWYLVIYLPLGLICHARAYVNFVHHRASGIPFEIMTAYRAHPTRAGTLNWAWFWPPGELQEGYLRRVAVTPVEIGDIGQAGVSLELVVWGASGAGKEALARHLLGDQSVDGLIRPEGPPTSGNPQPTRVGRRATEWLSELVEEWNPSEQRLAYSRVTVNSTVLYLYNAHRVWYVFAARTGVDVALPDHPELARVVEEAARRPGGVSATVFASGTFAPALSPEDQPGVMAALDQAVTKAGRWRPGEQSRSLLLGYIRQLDFRHAGLVPLHDSFLPTVLWSTFLYLPTLPVRYLLLAPLIVMPHRLVVPLAYLYLPVLLFLLWQCIRRVRREHRGALLAVSLLNVLILVFTSPG